MSWTPVWSICYLNLSSHVVNQISDWPSISVNAYYISSSNCVARPIMSAGSLSMPYCHTVLYLEARSIPVYTNMMRYLTVDNITVTVFIGLFNVNTHRVIPRVLMRRWIPPSTYKSTKLNVMIPHINCVLSSTQLFVFI